MIEFTVKVDYGFGNETLTVQAKSAAHMLQEVGRILARAERRFGASRPVRTLQVLNVNASLTNEETR